MNIHVSLVYDAVSVGECFLTFWRNIVSFIFKGQECHEECPMALEDDGTTLLQNGGYHSSSDIVPCLRKPQCSDTVLHKASDLTRRVDFNPLTPNDPYRGRSTPLTSKRCILYIYSTNIGTEYFKHGIYCPFLSLQNAVCFIILTYLVHVLFTFYIQRVLKLKKIIPVPNG